MSDNYRALACDYAALMARAAALLAEGDRREAAARVGAETQARTIQDLRAPCRALRDRVRRLEAERLAPVERLRGAT